MKLAHLFDRNKADVDAPSLTTQLRTTAVAVESAASAIDPARVERLMSLVEWAVIAVGLAGCFAAGYYLTRD